jgi:hypothetical protein
MKLKLTLIYTLIYIAVDCQIPIELPYSPAIVEVGQTLQIDKYPSMKNVSEKLVFDNIKPCFNNQTDFENYSFWNTPASLNEKNSTTYNWYAYNNLFSQLDSTTDGYRFVNIRDINWIKQYYNNKSYYSTQNTWADNIHKVSNLPASFPAVYWDHPNFKFVRDSMYSRHTALLIQTVSSFYENVTDSYNYQSEKITAQGKNKYKNSNQIIRDFFETNFFKELSIFANGTEGAFSITWSGDLLFTSNTTSLDNFGVNQNNFSNNKLLSKVTEGMNSGLTDWAKQSYFVANYGNKTYRVPGKLPISFSFNKELHEEEIYIKNPESQLKFIKLLSTIKSNVDIKTLRLPVNTKIKYSTYSTNFTNNHIVLTLEKDISSVLNVSLPPNYRRLPISCLMGTAHKKCITAYKSNFTIESKNKKCATQKLMLITFFTGAVSGLSSYLLYNYYLENPFQRKTSYEFANRSHQIFIASCATHSLILSIDFIRALKLVKTTRKQIESLNYSLQ